MPVKTIPLNHGKVAIVDDEDFERVSAGGRWCAWRKNKDSTWYAVGTRGGRTVRMHRFLMDAKRGEIVDHKDHDGLNNKRSTNLRFATDTENKRNRRGPARHSKTGIRGVRETKFGTFFATITVDRKAIYLGCFKTAEEASSAYAAANAKFFGLFGGAV